MPLSDNRFTVSESTGDVTEPFSGTVIDTISTTPLSDDAVKSTIIDWAASEADAGNVTRAIRTLALVAAENIDRVD
jgi:hypothetical protein